MAKGTLYAMESAFYSCHEDVSVISLILVGFVGGVLVSIMGIGGSLIMIPIMVYILKVSDVLLLEPRIFK